MGRSGFEEIAGHPGEQDQFLDVTQAALEPEVPPDRVLMIEA